MVRRAALLDFVIGNHIDQHADCVVNNFLGVAIQEQDDRVQGFELYDLLDQFFLPGQVGQHPECFAAHLLVVRLHDVPGDMGDELQLRVFEFEVRGLRADAGFLLLVVDGVR